MTLIWQHKKNKYSVTADQPAFGNLQLNDVTNVKTLDGYYYELRIVKIENDIYECEVISAYQVGD